MSTTAVTRVPGFCWPVHRPLRQYRQRGRRAFHAARSRPQHPTGQALCAKGRAAPELVYSKQRLTRPLRRTRPKGEADPGWVEISWDEALDTTAAAMRRLAAAHGPRSVAFSQSSPIHHRDRRFRRPSFAG